MGDCLKEDVFRHLFETGAIKYVDLQLGADGRAVVIYTQLNGAVGLVHTKRGDVKHYKPETAMRFLRECGLASVKVDMAAWDLSGQASLL